MLEVRLDGDRIHIGKHFSVSFMRTLRIPDDGKEYPLPPALDTLTIHRVADYAERVPPAWRERGGFFIPLYQREALWLSFHGHDWHPVAARVGIGRVDVLTGERWRPGLSAKPQNYVVVPLQPWLDGINSGDDTIRQFVAMPLGQGYTVEAQVTSEEVFGGLQLRIHDAKPGRFPEEDPHPRRWGMAMSAGSPAPMMAAESANPAMGLGAGGKMKQAIYPDPHGLGTWDAENYGEVFIHIVNSAHYQQITGEQPPSSPVDARTYTEHGYPWFDLYDEQHGDISPSDVLAGVKSIRDLDREKELPAQAGDDSFEVSEGQIRKLDLRESDPSGDKPKHWWDRLLHRGE
jgi:hypothetical protein